MPRSDPLEQQNTDINAVELVADIRARLSTADLTGKPVLHVFDECAANALASHPTKAPSPVAGDVVERVKARRLQASNVAFTPAENGDLDALLATRETEGTELDANGEAMVCEGCGTTKTIAAILAEHGPKAIACCPERKMVQARHFWEAAPTQHEGKLVEALRPFADYADPRCAAPDDLVITQGSGFAKRQLTMGDCYNAAEALATQAGEGK